MRTPYPNELMHYGVMGMKWGVRRYQNPDGTLTDEGKAHYGAGDGAFVKTSLKTRKLEKKFGKESMQARQSRASDVERSYENNWWKSYNTASDEFNRRIDGINQKYKGLNFNDPTNRDEHIKYVKEVNEMWKDVYTDVLLTDYGRSAIDGGIEWVNNAVAMNQYEDDLKSLQGN